MVAKKRPGDIFSQVRKRNGTKVLDEGFFDVGSLLCDDRQWLSLQVWVDLGVIDGIHRAWVALVVVVSEPIAGLFLAELLAANCCMCAIDWDIIDRVGGRHRTVKHMLRVARAVLLGLEIA